ncbi:MAG TPA: wax ester/triacylglycerol synthase family O-acyltransferase [Acidimicrobiia bacterium]|nr:wax ester/triacylglycerol synthase family O-acyltransferase [Acidimicrobiia bacterium]
MDRLSVLDAEFLHLEDGIAHLHIAGVGVFMGAPPAPGDLERLLAAKLHRIPRYRQRVRFVPLELGRPVWVDDPHFSLSYHVRRTALPSPGVDTDLRRLMARLMSQPLDRERPLWETWVVEGLAENRWALITKVHHCMVDGISGVDLLTVMLDVERDVELAEPEPWTPTPEPTGPAMVRDAWGGLVSDFAAVAGRWPGAARDPLRLLRSARETGEGLVQLGRHLGGTPPLSIEGAIGPHRVWAHSSATIDDVRTIRKAFGGTLNDVVLAAVGRGYRELLLSRGEDADHAVVRTLVPVSLRGADAHDVLDNRVSALLLELPVHIADPIERLRSVRDHMSALKGSHMAEVGGMVADVGNLAPPMIVGTVTRLAARVTHRLPQRSINTVTTNVPGPQFPLYCLGREMLEYHPFVPITHGVRVGTAILSYNGKLAFGTTGDFDTAPDVGLLAAAITDGIAELRDLAIETDAR